VFRFGRGRNPTCGAERFKGFYEAKTWLLLLPRSRDPPGAIGVWNAIGCSGFRKELDALQSCPTKDAVHDLRRGPSGAAVPSLCGNEREVDPDPRMARNAAIAEEVFRKLRRAARHAKSWTEWVAGTTARKTTSFASPFTILPGKESLNYCGKRWRLASKFDGKKLAALWSAKLAQADGPWFPPEALRRAVPRPVERLNRSEGICISKAITCDKPAAWQRVFGLAPEKISLTQSKVWLPQQYEAWRPEA